MMLPMNILSAEIENFRGLEKLAIPFDRHLTVFVGTNGSGKTAILDALALSLQNLMKRLFSGDPDSQECTARKEDFRQDCTPINIHAAFSCLQHNINCTLQFLPDNTICAKIDNQDAFRELLFPGTASSAGLAGSVGTSSHSPIPVFARYTAHRYVKTGSAGREPSFSKWSALHHAFTDQIDFAAALSWFLDKSAEEARTARMNRDPSFALPELAALRKAVTLVLRDYEAPYVDNVPPQLFIRSREHPDIALSVEQLGDSTRTMLALVMDLAHRMAIANAHIPWEAGTIVLHSPGIVLVDEIELHLHPSWQQTILPSLQAIFPNVQFIVTTQSPMVLSSVEDRHIRILEQGVLCSAPRGTWGADASRLLKRIFGVDSRPPSPATAQLTEYRELVYADAWDSERARQLRSILDRRYGGEEPELLDLDLYIDNRKWEQGLEKQARKIVHSR